MSGKGKNKSNLKVQLIPALDQRAKYTSRLSARSALYTELRLLLEGIHEPLTAESYRKIVLVENRLARSSTSARQKIWAELRKRYILDQNHPLYTAFWKEWVRCKTEHERGLTAYVLLALNDRLVADLGTQWLFSYLRRAPSEIRVEEVRAFIERSSSTHPEVQGWSTQTFNAVTRKYLASIRDFGLAQGKLKKVTVRPALYGSPFRLLIRALRIAGTKPMEAIQAHIFRLLGLESSEIIDALTELNRRGELRFKMQADIVEIDLEAA